MDDVKITVRYQDLTGVRRVFDVTTEAAVYAVKVPGKEGGVTIAAGLHGTDGDVARAIHTILKCAWEKGLHHKLMELQVQDVMKTGQVGPSLTRGGPNAAADFGELFEAMGELDDDDEEKGD